MADLATVLRNARSADPNIRNEAEKQLQTAESTNLSSYVYALSSELADESKPDDIRQLAGITLKNSFESKDEVRQAQLHQQWVAIDANVRAHVKGQIFRALTSASKPSRDTAAQVCAKIAKVELPLGLWPELIPELLKHMTGGSTEFLKQSTLLTLGYICEEIEPSVVEQQTNSILTAIVQGMRPEETNDEIKLAAAKALDNALEFAKNNFNNDNERNYIMTVILQATQSNNLDVKVAGASCLAKVALLYYNQLPTHMQSIFDVTLKAIKGTEQPVALQAVEFWSTVCEEELYLQEQLRQTGDMGLAPTVHCHNFIKGALKYLVPLILETLTKQDEDAEEGTWDIAMAGATCLQLIAATVADEVVAHVVPFVQANIVNQNWHLREAAIMAFGCILDGPQDSIVPLIRQALPVLLQSMKDASDPVKDTTAWTIGRVCQLHPIAIKGEIFPALLRILLDALPSSPRVAANVCWALHNIAESFGDEDPQQRPADTFLPYFTEVSKLLLIATERDDADENNLRSSAYEAINAFIDVSTPDCGDVVIALVGIFVDRLAKTFQKPILTADDRNELSEVQAVLCGVLQTSTKKLGHKIKPAADKLMELYLTVFNNKTAAVQEEALMAIGALANAVEADFERYLSAFFPFLLLGLRNYQEYQVCSVAVGVVGDASRAVLRKLVPYCDEIIRVLLEDLQNPQLNRSVKPPILSCFADVALAIGQDFIKYLGVVMGMLQNAATTNVNKDDDDMVDSLNELREAIFEAYTGIIQGLHSDQQAEQIVPYATNIVAFAAHVLADDTSSDDVIRAAITSLGDVGLTLGQASKTAGLNQPFILAAVKKAASGDAPKSTRETAKWVEDVIRKL